MGRMLVTLIKRTTRKEFQTEICLLVCTVKKHQATILIVVPPYSNTTTTDTFPRQRAIPGYSIAVCHISCKDLIASSCSKQVDCCRSMDVDVSVLELYACLPMATRSEGQKGPVWHWLLTVTWLSVAKSWLHIAGDCLSISFECCCTMCSTSFLILAFHSLSFALNGVS